MSKPRFHQFFNYRIPNKKKWLLTDSLLTTFKEELDKIFNTFENNVSPNYWNTYAWLDSTGGFYDALKITSEKYNVKRQFMNKQVKCLGINRTHFVLN